MRNLKRALSLALASVMLVGMMVVGTGASYKDVDSKDHVEAIEVLQAAGVMTGDENGNFNPDKVVTRAEMCVIICKMLYGSDLNVALFAGSTTFTDVPAWAQGYVNLCASLNIVSGVGDGKFDPDGTVTTAQAALMLLRALEVKVDLNSGNDWSIAAMAAAEDADLFEDMDVMAAGAGLTRNNVAQMVLNALKYTGEDEVYGIQLDDEDQTVVEFDNQKDALLYAAVMGAEFLGKIDKVDGSLIDEVFEIDVTNGFDPYGRPATTYSHEDWDQDLTYADEADYTYVISEDTTVNELISDKKLTKKITSGGTDQELPAGSVVELYVNDDKALTNVVNYIYALAEITDVDECDEDDDEDAIDDGAKYVLTVNLTINDQEETMYDIQVANFDAKTYVEDAMIVVPVVLYDENTMVFPTYYKDFENMGNNWVVIDTAVAASVDGKVTAKSDKFFRIDGEKYINSTSSDYTVALSNEGTFYLDPNNFVIGYAETEENFTLDNVAYVRDTFSKETTNDYGTKTVTYYAQLVKLDGTVENVVIGKGKVENEEVTMEYGVDSAEAGALVEFKAYTTKKVIEDVNYKGCTKLDAWTGDSDAGYYVGTIAANEELEADDSKVVSNFNGDEKTLRLKDATSYILIEDSLADIEVSVKTGGVNTTVAEDAIVIATKSTGNYVAAYVILPGSEAGAASYDDVIYVDADAEVEKITVDDTDCVKFDAYDEAGKKITITLEGEEIAEAGFYTYSINEDGIYTLENVEDELTENDGTGVLTSTFKSYYGTLLTVDALEDIETEGATIIDLHDTDVYNKTVNTLKAMKTAFDKKNSEGVKIGYAVNLDIYADDGAVIIVVTDVSVPED